MKTRFFISTTSLLLLATNIFSATTQEEKVKALGIDTIIKDEMNATVVIDKDSMVKSSSKITTSITNNTDTYRDVAIYNQLVTQWKDNEKNTVQLAKDGSFLADNESIGAKIAKYRLAKDNQVAKDVETEEIYNLTGYCTIINDIEIERLQQYSAMQCEFEDNEFALDNSTLFASFVPVYDKLALIGRPIYLKQGNRKLPIENGIILTIDQTNLNLATFINDKKIQNFVAETIVKADEIAYTNSMDYLEQKKNSAVTEDMSVMQSAGGVATVKTINTAPIDSSTYITLAGIQLASSVVGALGKLYIDSNYPMYKIVKYTQFYVDFNIKIKGKDKKLIDYKVDDSKNIDGLSKTSYYKKTGEK